MSLRYAPNGFEPTSERMPAQRRHTSASSAERVSPATGLRIQCMGTSCPISGFDSEEYFMPRQPVLEYLQDARPRRGLREGRARLTGAARAACVRLCVFVRAYLYACARVPATTIQTHTHAHTRTHAQADKTQAPRRTVTAQLWQNTAMAREGWEARRGEAR